tara:strand:+ start:1689 stop:1814 length:126 start_codon:yes stop_codon:yes gene_type:complete
MLPFEKSLQATKTAELQKAFGAIRLDIKPNQNTIKSSAEVL